MKVLGIFEAQIEIDSKVLLADFYVMEPEGDFLIGNDTAKQFGILKTSTDVNQIDVTGEEKSQFFPKNNGTATKWLRRVHCLY